MSIVLEIPLSSFLTEVCSKCVKAVMLIYHYDKLNV